MAGRQLSRGSAYHTSVGTGVQNPEPTRKIWAWWWWCVCKPCTRQVEAGDFWGSWSASPAKMVNSRVSERPFFKKKKKKVRAMELDIQSLPLATIGTCVGESGGLTDMSHMLGHVNTWSPSIDGPVWGG